MVIKYVCLSCKQTVLQCYYLNQVRPSGLETSIFKNLEIIIQHQGLTFKFSS